MMCMLNLKDGQIAGWIVGSDVHDLRRQAPNQAIAQRLYSMEFPRPGKYDLGDGYWLLVS